MELEKNRPEAGGKIIYLNGVSSAGKTSLARALQKVLPEPYLLLGIDLFIWMMSDRYWNDDPDGFTLHSSEEGLDIRSGPVAARMSQALGDTIVALAHGGNNLIVDDVIWDQAYFDGVLHMLAPFRHLLIKAECSYEVALQREIQRGDREIGMVKYQYARVQAIRGYDLTVDTGANTPEECALQIKNKSDESFARPKGETGLL